MLVVNESEQPELPSRVASTEALAQYLGLSRWTVSRVLNGRPGVKEETRRRVLEAMKELHFEPSPMARGLRGSPTWLVGVCYQELESPALVQKISILQRQLRQAGYRSILEVTGGEPDLEIQVVRHFLSMKADGIVLVASTLRPESITSEDLVKAPTAVVAVDPIHDLPFPQVNLDRRKAMQLELEHLYSLGHRSIGLMGFSDDAPYAKDRLEGIIAAARSLGAPVENLHRIWLPGEQHHDYTYGMRLAQKVLSMTNPPTGLIALSDRIAIGMIHQLRISGFRVPRDFSVIGFDNLKVDAYLNPGLTTIDQEIEHMMQSTVELLLASIEETPQMNTPDMRVIISPSLIVRESTGEAPNTGA